MDRDIDPRVDAALGGLPHDRGVEGPPRPKERYGHLVGTCPRDHGTLAHYSATRVLFKELRSLVVVSQLCASWYIGERHGVAWWSF